MPSQWLIGMAENNRQTSSTATTQQTVTVDLPRSNMLGAIGGTLRALGVGTPTLTIDRLRVIANGSTVIWDCEGGETRSIHKFENGSCPNGTLISTTDLAWPFLIRFGRFPRDEHVILPARIFKNLQLQITYTPGATTSVTSVSLDLWTEELATTDKATSKFIRRVVLVGSDASAANQLTRRRITTGNFLRSIYLHTDDLDNIGANGPVLGGTAGTANLIRVLINNGVEIPFAMRSDLLRDYNVNMYRFDDADTPDSELSNAAVFTGTEEMLKIDFDVDEQMSYLIDGASTQDIHVEFQAAGSGTSGDTATIVEEIVVVK